jgi:sucrose-6-phosphate hydrolase SacC (GH32 family)
MKYSIESSNALKQGPDYTDTIKLRILSRNDELKVALIEFETTTCTNRIFFFTNFNSISIDTWDLVEIYCLCKCASLLGDNKY